MPFPETIEERGTGKIARAPKVVREAVNCMLQDGKTQEAIIGFLESEGIAGVRPQNVSNWYQNGYQKWLKEQRRLDDMRAKREFAQQIVRENEGSNLNDAAMNIAAAAIYETLDEFDAENLKALLASEPANFSKIVNSLAKMSDARVKLDRYRQEVQSTKERALAELGRAKGKGGITSETLERIEAELKLL